MKQPAAILVLQYWYTLLVIPVFYQYLPVSATLVQILVNTKRIEYNSYSYVISAVHNIRGKSPVMSKYFVWSLRV